MTDTPHQDARADDQLLRDHVAGDPSAFGELFRRHQDKLWAVALRTSRDPEEASDALQDAMISAFRRASTFQANSKVSTWLHRIVVNACLDRMRSRRSKPTVPLPEQGDYLAPDPRDPINEHVARITVRDALAELPPNQRAAVVLVDLQGWSVEAAAEVLSCPPGTVKSRCHRGRARLAQILGNLAPSRPVSTTKPTDSAQPNLDSREGNRD
jgi:RNA polymerase sigma-70 factor (ECF subfamily)